MGHPSEISSDVESALIDAELFLKYSAPERALDRLKNAVQQNPRSLALRERLKEIAIAAHRRDEAARQCQYLASLYIEHEEFALAHDRLLEAKQLDPRLSITPGLEAIRRARRPAAQAAREPVPRARGRVRTTLAGDLAAVSIFDALQLIENSRLTGALVIDGGPVTGRILFNSGLIVDADSEGLAGEQAFKKLIQATGGSFDFSLSRTEFAVTIQASSNTKLILDSLREMDEQGR